jgi:uncharacterized repeat protein (TIGR03899 family)
VDIKDLAGLSKPLEKFVNVVAKGVGGFSKSYLIRKNADAKAYEIRQLADANKYKMQQQAESLYEAQKLLGNIEIVKGKLVLSSSAEQNVLSLPERIEDRKQYQEAKEQHNVEEITSIAAEELKNEESVSSEPVEEDWIARFFDSARLINDEQMQELWGKILAGEIKQPHSYSLRTLDILRNLSKHGAEVFVKVAKLAMGNNPSFIVYSENGKYLKENFNIRFTDLLLLQELDLMVSSDLLRRTHSATEKETTDYNTYGHLVIMDERPSNHPAFDFPIRGFTSVGTELLNLIDSSPDLNYIYNFAKYLMSRGCKVKYGYISERDTENIHLSDVREITDADVVNL